MTAGPLRMGQGYASEPPVNYEFDEGYVKDRFGGLFCVCLLLGGTAGLLAQQPSPAPAQEPGQNPPSQGPTTRLPPPLPPRPPDEYMPDEGKLSVGLLGWLGRGQPIIDAGPVYGTDIFGNSVHIPIAPPSRLTFQGQPKLIEGADLTIPVIKRNQVRISYFHANASGNIVAPSDLVLWGGNYAKGDYLSTTYRLQNVKVSYEFVTWPFPIGSRKIRLKTLYQFQYTHMTTAFDAPLKSTDNGPNTATGSKTLYAPTLGLGIDYYVTPHFRLEANATGFMIPHRWTIWDTDGSMAYRIGKVELRLGAKAFHFRTSPKQDYYLRGTMAGAFVGVRFFLK